MKKILFIEPCNFDDYPLGGQLSFARHLTTAMKGDIDLVGIRTDNKLPEGKWSRCVIMENEYNFFNLKNLHKNEQKPMIPNRISAYLLIKKYINQILNNRDYSIIIIQAPEVLLSVPIKFIDKVCLIMPGVGNPLQISRYRWARMFTGIYDKYFFSYLRHVNIILPAADKKTILEFIERGNGCVNPNKIVQFPTRYDANIFHIMQKQDVRKELNISQEDLVLVTTGRLNWYKGWKYMIDTFECFCKVHCNAKLYFIGKGEDEQKIIDYIDERNLTNKIFLAGLHPLPTVAKYLNAADVFIMGSYFEGWSTALVEAVACAIPCVVTNFSSAHDIVKDGYNGYVQDERDEVTFAELLDKGLLLDRANIEQAAKDAYSMSVQTMREQLNNILHFE